MKPILKQILPLFRAQNLQVGIISASPIPEERYKYEEWQQCGYYGNMNFLVRHLEQKYNPQRIAPGTQSLFMVALNYYQPNPLGTRTQGRIARYAWGRNYHKVLGKKLQLITQQLSQMFPNENFFYTVDSVGLDERLWAARAGLGFIGKNTLLIHPNIGSWCVLGEIFSTYPFPEFRDVGNKPMPNCGDCHNCLDVCPTRALLGPYRKNSSLCIAYLTIEHKDIIPYELRKNMQNWLLGCDLCQEVCPFNRHAVTTREPDFLNHKTGPYLELSKVLAIKDDATYEKLYAGSALMRAKRQKLIRNACIAVANQRAVGLASLLENLQQQSDPILQDHAAWALQNLS